MTAELKKLFMIMGVVFVFMGGVAFYFYHKNHTPAHILNPIVESMVRDLAFAKWDGPTLAKYATPEFQQWLFDNKLNTGGMQGFGYLGRVMQYGGIKKLDMNDAGDFAALVAAFQFQVGPGDVTLQLSKRDGKWLIYSFSVDSPVFHRSGIAK